MQTLPWPPSTKVGAADRLAAQAAFAAACLDPARAVPDGAGPADAGERARRFSVYRNNVVVGLTDVLAAKFPAVQSLVGEAFFRAAAGVFVRAEPPRSPIMALYGDDFPAFLAGFPPAEGVPYLADVARLEVLVLRAFHAADAPPLTAADFTGLTPDGAARLLLARHPAVGVLRSDWPVTALWEMNTGRRPLGDPPFWQGEDVLVTRPRWEVEVAALPAGAAAFLARLDAPAPLAEAAAAALATGDGDLSVILHTLLAAGALVRPAAPSEETHP